MVSDLTWCECKFSDSGDEVLVLCERHQDVNNSISRLIKQSHGLVADGMRFRWVVSRHGRISWPGRTQETWDIRADIDKDMKDKEIAIQTIERRRK